MTQKGQTETQSKDLEDSQKHKNKTELLSVMYSNRHCDEGRGIYELREQIGVKLAPEQKTYQLHKKSNTLLQ